MPQVGIDFDTLLHSAWSCYAATPCVALVGRVSNSQASRNHSLVASSQKLCVKSASIVTVHEALANAPPCACLRVHPELRASWRLG